MKRITIGLVVMLLALPGQAAALDLKETPSLRDDIANGRVPPVSERVPLVPSVVDMAAEGKSIGSQGGTLHTLMGAAKDTRIMTVYGYARLVTYTPELEIVPDILEAVDIEDGRAFTLKLRPGHKWSDGHPFTSADFRYYWEDMAKNEEISPFGLPPALLVDGERPLVEFPDETTVRYSWSSPNPYFLPALAGASPLYIYRPAHYLKQFHAKYQDADKLAAMIKKQGQRNWAALHQKQGRQYRNQNVDLPTLQPWVLATAPPSQRFEFMRNPFYHRIDPDGQQLPYIDRVVVDIAGSSLVPLKTGAGESDLQARYLRFDNFTFLKEGEERNDYTVRLWPQMVGAQLALFPNLNANDPAWREVLRDSRFRRALSLAIDRDEINQVVYFGLALASNNTVLPQSPLFKPEYQTKWAQFDTDRANALLDEMGLTKRDSEGTRLLPNGKPAFIVVETAGESTEQTDVLELIADGWSKIGVKLFTKPSQREVFRNRIFAGDTIMSIWSGLNNGNATAAMSPTELAPSTQQQLQWPKWGQYYETKGKAGEKPDLTEVVELADLLHEWEGTVDSTKREEIWQKMLTTHADQQYTIGLVCAVLQPVVVSNRLHNVPADGLWNWDPGAHFGIFRPDTFWLDGTDKPLPPPPEAKD
ncbi:MAG: ABC transporter substrate-binding protein [Alphaproteobacteria bacterium]|nr:ABC transporter substrate-binding protein [Alphaproteobacteria bacterium]